MAINIEEIYLEAEADIKNSAYVEAYKKYETILYEEPNYAPAHNSMGWLLKNQFDDLEKAENHFMAAMKSNPLYPHPYFHYAVLLTDMERYKDLEKHLDKCLKISTIDTVSTFGSGKSAKYLSITTLKLNHKISKVPSRLCGTP